MEKPCENDKIVGWLCICETCAKSDNPVCVNGDFEYYEATWGPFCDEYRKDFPEARYFYAKENVNFKEDGVWKLQDNRPIVFDDSLQCLDAEICYQYELFHEKALKKWNLFCEQYNAKDSTDTGKKESEESKPKNQQKATLADCNKPSTPLFRQLDTEGKRDVIDLLRTEMTEQEKNGEKMTDKEIICFVNNLNICRIGKNALSENTEFSHNVEELRKKKSVWTSYSYSDS